ncbi:hypothetical protein J7444_20090 [Labrenzia sp. R4_1]|uniref:hypothetical protein n=1 Tax=Stappiaceae TaxID=2821832 RepID=UPI001AD97C1E|nr:hypothetical protein [Labrenzia sp. R4_1]MBO9427047.1 hypothetical protein [Labrenzia sp. R4_1]
MTASANGPGTGTGSDTALQLFAAEVFKRDPDVCAAALQAARDLLIAQKRPWYARSKRPELEALEAAEGLVGLMKLLGETDPEKLKKIDRTLTDI